MMVTEHALNKRLPRERLTTAWDEGTLRSACDLLVGERIDRPWWVEIGGACPAGQGTLIDLMRLSKTIASEYHLRFRARLDHRVLTLTFVVTTAPVCH
jgi:hypothetical protein